MGKSRTVIAIRAAIPDFRKRKGWVILNAWVVEESHMVYLENGFFSYVQLDKGIGGRLIEPTFANQDDFIWRTSILGRSSPMSSVIDNLKEAWTWAKRVGPPNL